LSEILPIEAAWRTTPQWNQAHFEAELKSDHSLFCVVESGGRILGYASTKLIIPEAQILNIAVRPDCTRQGLGERLIAYLHSAAARAGCTKANLEVSETNIPAFRLYSKLGYRIVGKRPNYYYDGSNALLMEGLL
jgi:ribosomal-protein-alanine acetyltransferase